jgi:hypothetical protein
MVRLPSFPNSDSAEMSVSFLLLSLEMEWNMIQQEGKGGDITHISNTFQ